MNAWLEKGYITRMECGNNLAFVLQDESFFSATEYKVLHGQNSNGYVRCMHMLYNGQPELYYLTSAHKSLKEIYATLTEENRKVVLFHLLENILRVKHNGFLSCQNIDISMEDIFIDVENYDVSFIYLPLNIPVFQSYEQFEKSLRSQLAQLMEKDDFHLQELKAFQQGISNENVLLETLMSGLDKTSATEAFSSNNQRVLHMILNDSRQALDLRVDKEEFLVGKKPELCDGVVGFNKMISRLHCKITVSGDNYFITDLQSANGTYVNGIRLIPNEPRAILDGDIVRLANSEFMIRVEEE